MNPPLYPVEPNTVVRETTFRDPSLLTPQPRPHLPPLPPPPHMPLPPPLLPGFYGPPVAPPPYGPLPPLPTGPPLGQQPRPGIAPSAPSRGSDGDLLIGIISSDDDEEDRDPTAPTISNELRDAAKVAGDAMEKAEVAVRRANVARGHADAAFAEASIAAEEADVIVRAARDACLEVFALTGMTSSDSSEASSLSLVSASTAPTSPDTETTAPSQQGPTQPAPIQHAPVQHAPAQYAPAQYVPIQHAPAQHAPPQQAPATTAREEAETALGYMARVEQWVEDVALPDEATLPPQEGEEGEEMHGMILF